MVRGAVRWIVVALVAGLAGCSATGPTTGAAPTATATTANAGLGGPSAAVLADGRHAGYLTGLDLTARTVSFDKIDFLTGDAAKKEWKKQNPAAGEDGPPNDYMIVNNNPLLRTLPLAGSVDVRIADLTTGLVMKKSTLAALPKQRSTSPYWLTVTDGQVTAIEEQYVP